MYKSLFAFIFFLIFISLSLVACGKRGIPEPPSLVVPVKITDLRVDVAPGVRQLAWSLPASNADDSKPVDLKGFKVFFKNLPVDQNGCRFCDEGFNEYLDISLSKPTQGFSDGSTYYLPLPQVPFGFVYIFSVSSVNGRGWLSPVSNKLAVFHLPQVLPPTKLACQPSASVVDLLWQPPVVPTNFTGHLFYRVYRRNSRASSQDWQMITPEPVSDSEFIDVGLVDWGSYEYCVTAIVTHEDTYSESDFSNSTLVVPGDYNPPATVDNFSAFYYQGGIQLLWNASADSDLAGYRVYRHDSVTGLEQLFMTLRPLQHEFFDSNIVFGRTYTYWVTAFDQSDRKNESVPTPRLPVTVH